MQNHVYARKDIKQLGIAPMTSMFSCGNNERRMCDTIHPQIHDLTARQCGAATGSGSAVR